jgi:drug/metabolite transporter (DMT)-like permease
MAHGVSRPLAMSDDPLEDDAEASCALDAGNQRDTMPVHDVERQPVVRTPQTRTGQYGWREVALALFMEIACQGSGPVLRHYFQRHAPKMSSFALAADRVALAGVAHAAVLGFAWACARISSSAAASNHEASEEEEREVLIASLPGEGAALATASDRVCDGRGRNVWQLWVYGVIRTAQDGCQLVSVVLAPPSYVACVTLLYPFLTALLVRLFRVERARFPPLFFPAVLVSSAALVLIVEGSAIEGYLRGDALTASADAGSSLSSAAVGMTLAFGNIVCGALANVVVKANGTVPARTLMSYALGVEASFLALLTATRILPRAEETCVWPSHKCHDWGTLALLLFAAWGNLYLYLMSSVYLARALGPTLFVSFSSVAPVGTVVWSGLFLHESLGSGTSWGGMGLLVLTSCVYFRRQLREADVQMRPPEG